VSSSHQKVMQSTTYVSFLTACFKCLVISGITAKQQFMN